MKPDKIFNIIRDKMQNIKRQRRIPGAIVISEDIYYDIRNGEKYDGPYPFFPEYTQMQKIKYDKLFGLPLSTIKTTNKEYIEVYPS